jgi:hypothetical protein
MVARTPGRAAQRVFAMVECFDRIHLRLAEVVLRPLLDLEADPNRTTASVQPPGRGRRVCITVTKSRPDGPKRPAVFRWTAREADAAGGDLPDGRSWSDDRPYPTAEAAYWAAIDVVAASRKQRSRAPIDGVASFG